MKTRTSSGQPAKKKINEVRSIARKMGLKANGSKAQLIHRIQESEGNEPCYRTRTECDQNNCAWRMDCLGQ